jgi:hypothetical protein
MLVEKALERRSCAGGARCAQARPQPGSHRTGASMTALRALLQKIAASPRRRSC